jgi:hypothetical protein
MFKFHLSARMRAAISVAIIGATTANALTIIPTYDATILANTAAKNTLDSVIAFYHATFTDPITVDITFNSMGSGLGNSSSAIGVTSYGAIHNALIADATSADDAAALAQITSSPYSEGNMLGTKANFRALGFNVDNFASPDCTIGLNVGACFYGHANPIAGKYDLYAVACHEVDEALGTGSGIGGGTPAIADIFRYTAAGGRTFSTNTGIHTFFSIDGTTQIVEYNQFGRTVGDWGDWKLNVPAQVQDFQGTPGVVISPLNELRLLDVAGYDRSPVPEPATIALMGIGFAAMIRRRKN